MEADDSACVRDSRYCKGEGVVYIIIIHFLRSAIATQTSH